MFSFKVKKELHEARLSRLKTPHGEVDGPFFQFVATQAAIRGMVFSEDLEAMGVQIVLANTYHLHLRPGEDVVRDSGGLHGFMQWSGPITTDSGGYQVFSLGKNVKIDKDGVTFRAPLDGRLYRITPETAIEIQSKLGADIIMPLDVCTAFGVDYDYVNFAVEKTYKWAKRCLEEHARQQADRDLPQALYGIVQGSTYPDLRQKSAESLKSLNFFGYSIGGELQDKETKKIAEGVRMTTPFLPAGSPRYLMGYGRPEDIVEAVRAGVDHFDCVLPIRNARHGQLFYDLNENELNKCLHDPERPVNRLKLYKTVNITKSEYARDFSTFSPDHPVLNKNYTKAYVHHLMRAEIPSATRLTVLHNIFFYVNLMREIRKAIKES